jgi:chromosome segregation ATPase
MKKRGLYETMPPLKSEEEAKIKGSDTKLTEELAASHIVEQAGSEKAEIAKVLEKINTRVQKLKENIKFFQPYLEKKYERYSKEWHAFQDLAEKIYKENETLSDIEKIEANETVVAEKRKKVEALEKEVEVLEAAIEESKGKLKSLEEEQ